MSKEEIVKELHRSARKNFERRRYVMRGIDDTFQSDLIEMIPYASQNKNFKYIMVVIDTFSKFAWVVALKTKTGKEVTEAMNSIFIKNPNRIPKNLQTDAGKEFYNNKFQNLMKSYHINHYSTFSIKKASIAERFNRTFMNRMWYQFSLQGSHKWLSHLQSIVDSYNSSKHRTIKMKPIDVNKSNQNYLLDTVYRKNQTMINIDDVNKFQMNDYVRISKYKTIFEKGYTRNWSTEIFKISKILPTTPFTYILKDLHDNLIKGCFYEYELQKTENKDVYLVEKILRRRGNMIYVRWLGFPDTANEWINKNDLVK